MFDYVALVVAIPVQERGLSLWAGVRHNRW